MFSLGSFLPSSLSLLPTPRPFDFDMRKESSTYSTGELLLNAVKATELEELAARTALAIERYQGSSSTALLSEEPDQGVQVGSLEQPDQQPPSLRGEAFWTRHDFGSSNLFIFSRDNGEILTLRKSPTGEGWTVIYDEPAEDCPE